MPCASRSRRIFASSVSSSGSRPPSESERPWQTNGWRSVNARSARPYWPPTPIQFSGAISKKSIASGADATVSCSGPNKARRRPSPAPRIARGLTGRSDRAAAAAFGALLLVATTGAFRSLLLRAAAVHDGVHGLELVGIERAVGVLVPCLDLAL